MEEVIIKLVSQSGIAVAVLLLGVWYMAKENRLIREKILAPIQAIQDIFQNWVKLEESVKKIDALTIDKEFQSIKHSLEDLNKSLVEIKTKIDLQKTNKDF